MPSNRYGERPCHHPSNRRNPEEIPRRISASYHRPSDGFHQWLQTHAGGRSQHFIQELLPLATLLTPNIPEAEILAGMKIQNKEDIQNAALAISKLGCKYVLIKGGHFQGAEKIDYLFEDGKPITSYRGLSVNTRNTHGTGCTLSSAITSYLAREMDMNTAIAMAKTYLSGAILAGKDVQIGKGHGPVNHFYEPKALFIK